jgi:hypothetical protein
MTIGQHNTYVQTSTQTINDAQYLSLVFTFDLSSSSSEEDHRNRSAINPIEDILLQQQQESSSFVSEEDKYFEYDGPDDRLKFEHDKISSQKHSDYLGAQEEDLGAQELPILDQQDMSTTTSRIVASRSKSDDLIQFSSTRSSDEPDFEINFETSDDVSHATLKPVTASETICKNPFESSSSSRAGTTSVLNKSAYDWTTYSNTRYSEAASGDPMENILLMTKGADDHLKNDVNPCGFSDNNTYSTTAERKFPQDLSTI